MQIQIGNYSKQKESFLQALSLLKIKYDHADTASDYFAINRVQNIVLKEILDILINVTLQGTLVPELIRTHPFKDLKIKVERDLLTGFSFEYFRADDAYKMLNYIKEKPSGFKLKFYYNNSNNHDTLQLNIKDLSLVYVPYPGFSESTKAKAKVFIQSLMDHISVVPLDNVQLKGVPHED